MTITFYRPQDPYGPFSNFSAHKVALDGKMWKTSEHYYQAQKFSDEELQTKVRLTKTPGEAAKMGRDMSLPLREDWEVVKDDVMRKVVNAKFTQHRDLRKMLLDTGDEYLIEASFRDAYWGWGKDKKGKNMLGRILMEVREELKEVEATLGQVREVVWQGFGCHVRIMEDWYEYEDADYETFKLLSNTEDKDTFFDTIIKGNFGEQKGTGPRKFLRDYETLYKGD